MAVWQVMGAALGLPTLPASSDFFEAGGTSLSAAQVAFQLSISMADMYRWRTPEALWKAWVRGGVRDEGADKVGRGGAEEVVRPRPQVKATEQVGSREGRSDGVVSLGRASRLSRSRCTHSVCTGRGGDSWQSRQLAEGGGIQWRKQVVLTSRRQRRARWRVGGRVG